MSRRSRPLDDSELELWKAVTRSIKPLRRARAPAREAASESPAAPRAGTKTLPKPKSLGVLVPQPSPPPTPPALAPLGRRMLKRLARGTEAIDGRLDLHGRTQAEAHAALLGFLRGAQAGGAKNVLIITGKGGRESGERGVLRRQVPLWLKLPEFRKFVVGFEPAHVAHGGQGAFYIRLRRAK